MIKYSEDNENIPQILAIGVGGTGASVIDKINSDSIRTFLIDSEDANVKELKPFVESLPKAEIVFVISGLGGSTGTAVAPDLVELLKEKTYWVWSLCTIPFFFEGKQKIINSLKTLKLIQQYANTILVIPHDKIFKMVDKNLSMKEVFTPANNLCAELVLAIRRLTSPDGKDKWINIKFSDIKNRIVNKKTTSFGFGEGRGIQTAIEQAISGPLLDKEVINSADGIILSVSGSKNITLDEVNKGIESLRAVISKDIDIIFGVTIDPPLRDRVKVGIITTGLDMASNIDSWDLSSAGVTRETGLARKSSVLIRTPGQGQKPTQTMIDFKKMQKGCFEKSEATVFGGIDLDVPTFMRKKR